MRTPKIDQIGFELECEMSRDALEWVEDQQWADIGHDGSISRCHRCVFEDLEAVELRSIPVDSTKKVAEFFQILDRLYKRHEYHFNRTMGFHIHISFRRGKKRARTVNELTNHVFTKMYLAGVKRIFPEVYRKRWRSQWCRINRKDSDWHRIKHNRYVAVNIRPLESLGTIEFRIFPAEKPERMWKYLNFTHDFVEHYLKIADKNLYEEITAEIDSAPSRRKLIEAAEKPEGDIWVVDEILYETHLREIVDRLSLS